jgi:hypothetical protein
MSAPIQPEVVEPPVENPPAIPAEPTIPASPPAQSTELRVELDRLSRQTISEQAGRIQQLQEELANRNATPVAPTPPTAFFENPHQAIRDEVARAVAPLVQFTQQISKQQAYQKLVGDMQANAPHLYAAYQRVQSQVDATMANADPTPANLQFAILSATGAAQLGLIPGAPAPVAPNPPTPAAPLIQPPNIPPSPPTPPRKATGGDGLDAKVAALTESERAAAKMMGFSDLRQYVEYRDADPEVSAWSGIGRPPK